jgi:hypothetical protein
MWAPFPIWQRSQWVGVGPTQCCSWPKTKTVPLIKIANGKPPASLIGWGPRTRLLANPKRLSHSPERTRYALLGSRRAFCKILLQANSTVQSA